MNLVRFLKDWTLPVAMAAGVSGYFLFAEAGALSPLRPAAGRAASALTPALVFAQLLLVFCKVRPSELRVRALHGWLLAVQLAACLGLAGALAWCPAGAVRHEVLEGAMVCFICPTATAAAVVTGKLGGSAATLTTYTLLSNLLAAAVVPLVFPWVEPHAGVSFWGAFLRILGKVFPLLICPFLLACALRRFAPGAHGWLVARGGAAFYLWGVALAIVSGQTAALLAGSAAPARVKWLLALAGLAACAAQFWTGKRIGGRFGERVSGGQALGQKNTVLGIWMAQAYLDPLSSVAAGSYVLWQNSFNSWQLWRRRRRGGADGGGLGGGGHCPSRRRT